MFIIISIGGGSEIAKGMATGDFVRISNLTNHEIKIKTMKTTKYE